MVRLRGMTWDHPRGNDPLVATARVYAQAHPGVEIVWDRRSLQDFEAFPVDVLAASYDLMVIDHPHVGAVAASGSLVALDEVVAPEALARLAGAAVGPSHRSYYWANHQWALAIDAAAQVSAYRPDLIAAPPATWDEVREVARAGRVIWPLNPTHALMSLYSLAASRGTPCAASPARWIGREDGLAVLEALREVALHVPAECLHMDPIQTLERLAVGDQYAYAPLLFGYVTYARTGFRSHTVAFANMPALGANGPRGSTLGGTGMALSARSAHVHIAADYACWIAGADCQRGLYTQAGGQPASRCAWEDDEVNRDCNGFYRATRATLEGAWVRPRYDGYMRFQDRGGAIVGQFLAGDRDADDTLARLEDAYQESRPVL